MAIPSPDAAPPPESSPPPDAAVMPPIVRGELWPLLHREESLVYVGTTVYARWSFLWLR
jgi:hypothetical protein